MIGRMFARRALGALVPLIMAGCASMKPAELGTASPAAASLQARPYSNDIALGGRISVRYQGERQEEALHGSFTWSQTEDRTNVVLLSPLGQTLAVVDSGPDGASLTQAGQPARTAPSVDVLTRETLGWPLPVSGLRYWLQGFAFNQANQQVIASPGHAEVVTRDGWRLRYPAWDDDHPKRIDLARLTEQAGEVSIRIVIDSWQQR